MRGGARAGGWTRRSARETTSARGTTRAPVSKDGATETDVARTPGNAPPAWHSAAQTQSIPLCGFAGACPDAEGSPATQRAAPSGPASEWAGPANPARKTCNSMAYRPRTRSPARHPGRVSLRARVMAPITHFASRASSRRTGAWQDCACSTAGAVSTLAPFTGVS